MIPLHDRLPRIEPRSRMGVPRGVRGVVGVLVLLFGALTFGFAAFAAPAEAEPSTPPAPVAPPKRWPAPVVELARTLPLQEGGRVMPFAQWARFTLLRLNHRETAKDASNRTLSPVEWALDVWFRPEVAAEYPTFLVETSEVLDAVDFKAPDGRKKRDRYSYFELADVRNALFEKARAYEKIDAKKRDPVQGGITTLASNLRTFERIADLFAGSRFEVPLEKLPAVRGVFGGATSVRASDVFAHLADLRVKDAPETDPRVRDAAILLSNVNDAFGGASVVAAIPPAAPRAEEEAWFTPAAIFERALSRRGLEAEHLDELRRLEDATRAAEANDMPAFQRAFQAFHAATTARATARGEYGKVGLEVFLIRLDPFFWAKVLYLLALVVVAGTWIRATRWLSIPAWGLLGTGLALHVTGIVIRCVLRGRPPVTTLYETTLFIAAIGVAGALCVEAIQRRGFGLAIAPILGALGLFISNRYETITGDDPMPQLVAVLDTNFWLSTHVTCVTMGYSASLLAAGIAHVHVLSHVTGWKREDGDFQRSVAKAVYGVLAFGLFFSTVGTILGGIWANESWGRFWGWDPKENGALMIVLAQLAILHGRMGGILKPLGVSLASIGMGCVVVFSWWGVNLLGVGLHAYGFTAGLWTGVQLYWGIELLVIGAGILVRRAA